MTSLDLWLEIYYVTLCSRGFAMVYSAEQLTKRAIVIGTVAYKSIIRSGGSLVVANQAYNRAYSRSIPPCWASLLPPPRPPSGDV